MWNKLEAGLGTGTRDGMTGIDFKLTATKDVTESEEMWDALTATKGPATKLRQVWFPGNHSDVGGGLATQQIATISLACKFHPTHTHTHPHPPTISHTGIWPEIMLCRVLRLTILFFPNARDG